MPKSDTTRYERRTNPDGSPDWHYKDNDCVDSILYCDLLEAGYQAYLHSRPQPEQICNEIERIINAGYELVDDKKTLNYIYDYCKSVKAGIVLPAKTELLTEQAEKEIRQALLDFSSQNSGTIWNKPLNEMIEITLKRIKAQLAKQGKTEQGVRESERKAIGEWLDTLPISAGLYRYRLVKQDAVASLRSGKGVG